MKKLTITFLFLAISSICHTQIKYEKGYFINNEGQKVNCLIKNVDWKNNPTKIQYKLSENSLTKTLTTKSINAFEIFGALKYIRAEVQIDRSDKDLKKLSTQKEPIFTTETLLLRVLIEGQSNLYMYEDENLKKYFYSKNSETIKQLIYKKYILKTPTHRSNQSYEDKFVKVNNLFQKQLWDNLNCDNLSLKKTLKISYRKDELIVFFKNYNTCNHSDLTYEEIKQERDLFHLSIRPGYINSTTSINGIDIYKNYHINYKSQSEFRFGIEAEYVLPYNKNKWSLFIEPTFHFMKATKLSQFGQNGSFRVDKNVSIEYKTIDFPFGLRHYFFINDNSKIFIDAAYVLSHPLNSKFRYYDINNTRNNIALGLGYNKNNKHSIQFRYGLKRNILGGYNYLTSSYTSFSIIYGYTIF